MHPAIEYAGGRVIILDQRRLPGEVVFWECSTYPEVAEAIRSLAVRGAPAIGIAAAYGLVLAADSAPEGEDFWPYLERAAGHLRKTRPTAVNLFWALDRMLQVGRSAGGKPAAVRARLTAEAAAIAGEDLEMNRLIGQHGSALIPDGARVLTHCNAGALATAGFGTALGVIRAAVGQGRKVEVFADETRPLLQGARLTAWELMQDGIPVTLVTDGMAGHLMRERRVDLVLVGADRIAANGDVANKIGTYGLAVLARAHGLPFYVAAPTSTVDMALDDGSRIVIEERAPEEVTSIGGVAVAPAGVKVYNPAFDVTPAELVTALITDWGILRPPLRDALRQSSGA